MIRVSPAPPIKNLQELGLGLSLAKQIVDFHYGEIMIASTVRQGTT